MPEKRPGRFTRKPVPLHRLDNFSDGAAQVDFGSGLPAKEFPDAYQRLNQKRGFDQITAIIEFRKGNCLSAGRVNEVGKSAVETFHRSERQQHAVRTRDCLLSRYP